MELKREGWAVAELEAADRFANGLLGGADASVLWLGVAEVPNNVGAYAASFFDAVEPNA